jgi:hypothetical protein
MEIKAWSHKQDSLAAGLAFLMRSAQRPLLGALRAFERPLFRRAHGPTPASRRHKMRVRRQHQAPTALTSLTENSVQHAGKRGLSLRHETDATDAPTRCLTRHLDAPQAPKPRNGRDQSRRTGRSLLPRLDKTPSSSTSAEGTSAEGSGFPARASSLSMRIAVKNSQLRRPRFSYTTRGGR